MIPTLSRFVDRLVEPIVVAPDAPLTEVAGILAGAPDRRCVFVRGARGDSIEGVIALDEMLGLAATFTGRADMSWGRLLHFRNAKVARDVQEPVHVLGVDATLNDALNHLKACDEDEVLVFDGDRLLGSLTEPALLAFLLETTAAFPAPTSVGPSPA